MLFGVLEQPVCYSAKLFHMLSQANFPDEGSEKAVSFCDKTKLGGWASII